MIAHPASSVVTIHEEHDKRFEPMYRMMVTMENPSIVMDISGKMVNMAILTETSTGALILRQIDGELKIALAQHKRSEKSWVIPKGHVELNESLEQAALREIQEETGLTNIQLLSHLGTVLRKSTRSNGDIVHKTVHYYLAYALNNNQPDSLTFLLTNHLRRLPGSHRSRFLSFSLFSV